MRIGKKNRPKLEVFTELTFRAKKLEIACLETRNFGKKCQLYMIKKMWKGVWKGTIGWAGVPHPATLVFPLSAHQVLATSSEISRSYS